MTLNGQLVTTYAIPANDPRQREGHIGLQSHTGNVQFRNVLIRTLYWEFLFGILTLLPHFPHAFALNPFTALVLTILGGSLGTQIFTPVMKRFGL